jgi:hypothetical protein
MNDNMMLIDHRDILLENYNSNYSYRMIGKVEDNNIEAEDDMLDNT